MWSFLNIENDPVRVLVTRAAGMSNPLFFWFIFLLFDFFFFILVGKVQVNINLESNIFYFLIWALFIVIGTKETLKKLKEKPKKNPILKKRLASGYLFH
jgi:hypothetical protein